MDRSSDNAWLRVPTAAGRGALLAAVLASGMAFLDSTVVNVALPRMGRDLGASVAGLQWTVNGYTLTLAAFVLLGGALGDRYGRRRIFLLGTVWFAAASLLCGLAPTLGLLVAARVVQGAGAALLVPGSLALLQSSFHPDERGRAIGIWSGLSGVSTAVGPLLGGWLIDTLSWRWIFFLNAPLAVAVVVAALRWIPESREAFAERVRFDTLGALLGAAGLAGVTYGLIEARSVPRLAAAFGVAGVVALVAFVLVERRRPDPMVPPGLFADRQFSAINAVTLFVYAGLSGVAFFLVVQLQVASGWSALAAGLALLPLTVLLLVGSGQAGALNTRIGPRIPLTVGPAICAAGCLLLTRVGAQVSYLTEVLPAAVLLGAGLTVVVAPLTASVLAAAPTDLAGVASGVNNAVARAAGLLAVAALPLLVGLTGTEYADPVALTRAYRAAMLWCAGLFGFGCVLSLLLVHGRTRRDRPGPPAEQG